VSRGHAVSRGHGPASKTGKAGKTTHAAVGSHGSIAARDQRSEIRSILRGTSELAENGMATSEWLGPPQLDTAAPLSGSSRMGVAGPLRVTEPSDPDEVEADRFADAALEAIDRLRALGAMELSPAVGGSLDASASRASFDASGDSQAVVSSALGARVGLPGVSHGASGGTAPVHSPSPGSSSGGPSPAGSRTASPEALAAHESRDGDEGELQDHETQSDRGFDALPGIGAGDPLDPRLRRVLEPILGISLGLVRIHRGGQAGVWTRHFDARAFAYGRDVFFASGGYDPASRSGLHLLLHELAHVVQFARGAMGATADRDRPAPVVARGPLRGAAVHQSLEQMLIERHKSRNLIREAVLPGGNRDAHQQLDKIGFPDLYWSSAGNKVPWVRGRFRDDDSGHLDYVPMSLRGLRRAHPTSAGGRSQHEPTVDAQQNFSGDFPDEYKVAEIKPIGFKARIADLPASVSSKAGEGFAQSNNYIAGFDNFVAQARKDGKTAKSPRGGSLTTENDFLPPAVDYRNFKKDGPNRSPSKPNMVFGSRRYWVYPLKRLPVLYYFDLPHPYAASDYTRQLDDVFRQLEGLTRTLGKRQAIKKVGFRRATGRRRARVARKTNWKALHGAWERRRKTWDDTKAKPFLRTGSAKAIEQKASIDRKLQLPRGDDPAAAQRARKFKQVERFSGRTGKILGQIRYALGPLFEKITPFFDWLKKKLKRLVGGLRRRPKLSVSWAQTVFNAVFAALGTVANEAVAQLFGKFQSCIIGMVNGFLDQFKKDLTEDLAKPFEEAKKSFFEWLGTDPQSFGQLMKDVEASLKKYTLIIEGVLDAKRLVNEIRVYEFVIRGIVQAASCVSPPALGCLWGVVAQLGLPAIVGLALRTDLFQEKVVRPLVRDLVRDIFDEPFSRIIKASVDAIGLGKWAKDVPSCNITPIDMKRMIDGAVPSSGMKITDPAFLKEREKWQQLHRKELEQAARNQVIKQGGTPATPEELEKLLDQVKDLVPEAGTVQDALDRATRPDGKIDFDKFARWARGQQAAPPKRRAGGWSTDSRATPDARAVEQRLRAHALAKIESSRLVELVEDSRDADGRVNVDHLARKIEMHLQRRQIKRDVEARLPSSPGVPMQREHGFTDQRGGAAAQAQMLELIDSLAKANLGEESAARALQSAYRSDGTLNPVAARSSVDRVSSAGRPPASTAKPGKVPPGGATRRPGRRTKPFICVPPLCIRTQIDQPWTDFSVGPVRGRVGPQEFPGGAGEGGGSVLPGIRLEIGPSKKQRE